MALDATTKGELRTWCLKATEVPYDAKIRAPVTQETPKSVQNSAAAAHSRYRTIGQYKIQAIPIEISMMKESGARKLMFEWG